MRSPLRRSFPVGALAVIAALTLASCAGTASAGDTEDAAAETTTAQGASHDSDSRIALTYDGGILVLDGDSLDTLADLPAEGFLRLGSAGDKNGHVFVTMAEGFQVLDTGITSGTPVLSDVIFPADHAGHAIPHEGQTILFADGTGDMTLFDTDAVNTKKLPETVTLKSEAAHHGVALTLSDGSLLASVGTEESVYGVRHLDADGTELGRNEQCPSVHGEGVLKDGRVVFGCQDGVLLFADGKFTKIQAPDAFGRAGNAYVTESSPLAVLDYNRNPDSEGYLLSSLALVDTDAATMSVVDLPENIRYTWRGVGRDVHDNIIVLSSDGSLYKLDAAGKVTDSWKVIDAWEGPVEWQNPHPALRVVGDTAYVTDPATKSIHSIDLHDGEVIVTGKLGQEPNEIAIVGEGVGHAH